MSAAADGAVHLDWREGAAWLTLDRPGRGNALVPELLAALRARINEARQAGAAALVLFHNHPSGDPEPSEDDVRLTERLAAAGILTIVPGALVIYFVRNYIAKGFALGRV